MKQKDVIIGRKYQVRRVDNGNILPKYRTCQALYPLQQSETNHV
jgi:hypothetical protein